MKSVNKIIAASCVFCYFAGLYIIAAKMGLIKLIVRHGVSKAIEEIPETFPDIKYLYISLAVYTLIFIIISTIIIAIITRHGKDMDKLHEEASEVFENSAKIDKLINQSNDSDILSKLRLLQRQIAALPPSVIRDTNMKISLGKTISNLVNVFRSNEKQTILDGIDAAMNEIKSLKYNYINRR